MQAGATQTLTNQTKIATTTRTPAMPACAHAVGCSVCDTPELGRRGPVCACMRMCWCRRIFTYIHTYRPAHGGFFGNPPTSIPHPVSSSEFLPSDTYALTSTNHLATTTNPRPSHGGYPPLLPYTT